MGQHGLIMVTWFAVCLTFVAILPNAQAFASGLFGSRVVFSLINICMLSYVHVLKLQVIGLGPPHSAY